MSSTICITGTGTGVGKTILTALLTIHLRKQGKRAVAVKPYCSGSLDDARLLAQANEGELSLKEVSPVYCLDPVAPYAALTHREASDAYRRVLDLVSTMKARYEILLIEGAGGAAVPITQTETIANIMVRIGGPRISVGSNRLGILNETLLTEAYFSQLGASKSKLVLMQPNTLDPSFKTNAQILQQVLPLSEISTIPYLAGELTDIQVLEHYEKKMRKTLVQITK